MKILIKIIIVLFMPVLIIISLFSNYVEKYYTFNNSLDEKDRTTYIRFVYEEILFSLNLEN
jgi:hypothetical protein